MIHDFLRARTYLAPQPESWWQWLDGGEVIALLDGTTIAFRAELLDLLRGLAPRGLPSMSLLVLFLAACRENWDVTRREVAHSLDPLAPGLVQRMGVPSGAAGIERLLSPFDRLHELPSEFHATLPARVALARQVFETQSPAVTAREAGAIVRGLENNLPEEFLTFRGPAWTRSEAVRELLPLGMVVLDAETLRLRQRTGLDQLPVAAAEELAPTADALQFIAASLDDPEVGGVARIAQQLLAAVHLPRSLSDPEELALGGVSDITNRGPLDRLLLSELANDDLTLTVRVAVNEALYLRRESPPRTPPRDRAIFIDTGLRMWGVPRVFATAVALSLSVTHDPRARVLVYRPEGNRVRTAELTHREGMLEQLAALELAPHPGAALETFLATCDPQQTGDVVLVLGEDVLSDPAFQRVLAEVDAPPLFIATVARDGDFRLWLRTARGMRLIREAQLKLSDLLAPRRNPAVPLIRTASDSSYPAILSADPFPLRLPTQFDPARTWKVDSGAVMVTRDRRLMYWPDLKQSYCPYQITDRLPGVRLLWKSVGELGMAWCVVAEQGTARHVLIRIDTSDGTAEQIPLEVSPSPARGFCMTGGQLFSIHRSHIEKFDVTTGARLSDQQLPPGMTWAHDTLFRQALSWHALIVDGFQLRFEEITQQPALLALFRCAGIDGYVGIRPRGELYFTADQRQVEVRHSLQNPVEVQAVAPDGSCVCIGEIARPYQRCLVSIPSGEVGKPGYYGDAQVAVQPGLQQLYNQPNLRWHFLDIAVSSSGSLVLFSKRHDLLGPLPPGGNRPASFGLLPAGIGFRGRIAFLPIDSPPGAGYRLKVATWSDGSRAFLDSRGLLHLVSADPQIPQLTLVLQENKPLSGWSTDGRLFGQDVFTARHANATAEAVFHDVLSRFVRWLP